MNVVLYGAGDNCADVILNLKENPKYEILCAADRDPAKWGQRVDEKYEIVRPQDIAKYSYDLVIVTIGRENDLPLFREQLSAQGVDGDRLVHCQEIYRSMTVHPKNIGTMRADWEKNLRCEELYANLCAHAQELSELEREFLTGVHNRSFKWLHYFEIYNRHLSPYYGKDVTVMEVGVYQGGSLQLWKKVFGPRAQIIGVDIMPECKKLEDEQIQIYIGDQTDRSFWKELKERIPQVDILIDDGGHEMKQQIVTFEEMFPFVKENGVYLCEDTGTSYNPGKFHAGYRKSGTWIEYAKNFVDYLHGWFSMEKDFGVNDYTESMHSVHYYPGVTVIEKRKMYPPFDMEVCNTEREQYAISHFHSII